MDDKWNEFEIYNNKCQASVVLMRERLSQFKMMYSDLRDGFDEQLLHTANSHRRCLYHNLTWSPPLSDMRQELSQLISDADGFHAEIIGLIDDISETSSLLFDYFDELIDENKPERLEQARNYFLKSHTALKDCKEKESDLAKSLSAAKLQSKSLDKIHLSPEIFKLEQDDIRLLHFVVNTRPEHIQRNITKEIAEFLRPIHKHFGVYRLRFILSKTPVSDVTIIACSNPKKHVYWKLDTGNLQMQLVKKNHSQIMGPAMNQLSHVTCSHIVAAEIVSAVRHIDGRDSPIVPYSPQDIIDFAMPSLRAISREEHYCYKIDLIDALRYVKREGIQRLDARPLVTICQIDVSPRQTLSLGYIRDFKELKSIEEMLRVLENHPVAATIPIFEPEYSKILDKIYRGPTSRISRFVTMHAVNVTGGDEENGEKFFWARSSLGGEFGVEGCMKISADMMMMCLNLQEHEWFMEYPFRLLNQFIYPTLLSREDEEERKKREGNG